MIDDYLYQPSVDENEHIIASYYLKGSNLLSVAKALAVGQSIGNPSLRSGFETEEILVDHLAKILDLKNNLRSKKRGVVRVAFPLNNFDIEEDGVTQILCTLMGGQMDIEYIQSCRLLDVQLPGRLKKCFKGPKFGMPEIKRRAGAENRPLLGGIIKPKTGMNLETVRVVESEVACRPCYRRLCPIDHRCMTRLQTGDVLEALDGLTTLLTPSSEAS